MLKSQHLKITVAAALISTLVPLAGAQTAQHATPATMPATTQPSAPSFSCKFRQTALTAKHGVDDQALSYFISVHDHWAYYITPDGNRVMDLSTGKSTPIPGDYDPVPTPDGKFITMPGKAFDEKSNHGIYWYDAQKFRKGLADGMDVSNAKPVEVDKNDGLRSVYQSTGILKKNDGKTWYRVVDSGHGLNYQDYYVNDKGVPTPVSTEPVRPCSNLQDQQLQLPMLSKDGQYISAYDTFARSTKIYHLTDDKGGCEEVVDLGVPTGKVDFDFNNDRIAFHMDYFKFDSHWFSGVSNFQTRDIFVMKVKKNDKGVISGTGPFARLTSSDSKGYGTYYPRWNSKGTLLASHAEVNTYSLNEFDPTKAQYQPWWSPVEKGTPNANVVSRYALGSLWNNACADAGGIKQDTVTEASFFALSLDPQECKKMVHAKWSAYREQVAEEVSKIPNINLEDVSKLTEKDLDAACPDEKIQPAAATQNGAIMASKVTPKSVFAGACRDCHTGSFVDPVYNRKAPKIDFDDFAKDPDLAAAAARYIQLSRTKRMAMPPATSGQLNDDQKKVLVDYLNGLAAQDP